MIRAWTSTWGLTVPEFLWGYGALCVVAAAGMWAYLHSVLGPHDSGIDAAPDLGLYELAMLSGGAQLAITSAAARLLGDGTLKRGATDGTLELGGELEPDADRLEREVYESVRGNPGITADALRAELEYSEPVRWMTDELTSAELLVQPSRSVTAVRRLLLIGGLLAALGIARLVVGGSGEAPIGYLVLEIAAVVVATIWVAANLPFATDRGREVLTRRRDERDDLRQAALLGDVPLAAALFGGGLLWLVQPAAAAALGIPREDSDAHHDDGGWGWGWLFDGNWGGWFGDDDGGCGGCGGCG